MNTRWFVDTISESAAGYPHKTFTRKGAVYTCVNPFSYHLVRQNSPLFMEFDGLFVDGLLMCGMINVLWNRRIPRLSFDMSGMAADLFRRLNDSGSTEQSIYFIGAKQDLLEQSIAKIKSSYPKLNVKGYRNGYFSSQEDRENAIRDIVASGADFAVVGMGSPLQEQFSVDLHNSGFGGIIFTCGGFLHQTANRIYYYPQWINKYNLRAFYRLFHEKGLWKRLYNVLIQFPALFILDSIKTRIHNSTRKE